MMDGGTLASHNSQHVGRCFSVVSHCKKSHHGCFSRPGTQGSAISAFNPLADSAMCAMQTGVLFLGLSGSGRGNSKVYVKGLPAVLEGVGQLVCSTGFTKQCHLFP